MLTSVNWGLTFDDRLWLPENVHAVCAETVVKGHMAQCKNTNGFIAESFHKIAKMASKVPDYEYQFEEFCWDVLLRLKLPIKVGRFSLFSFPESSIIRSLTMIITSFARGRF